MIDPLSQWLPYKNNFDNSLHLLLLRDEAVNKNGLHLTERSICPLHHLRVSSQILSRNIHDEKGHRRVQKQCWCLSPVSDALIGYDGVNVLDTHTTHYAVQHKSQ